MGRKKIYKTKEDKYDAELKWKREWYYRNAKRIKETRMEDYWRKKGVEKEKRCQI